MLYEVITQPAWLQRIALQGHRQGKDKFRDQQPACSEGVQGEDERIDEQKGQDGDLVPLGRTTQEIDGKSLA